MTSDKIMTQQFPLDEQQNIFLQVMCQIMLIKTFISQKYVLAILVGENKYISVLGQ